ncbi:carboxymuconolactone decarboxylase family protein [Microbacterium sp. NPDC089318]
MNHLQYINTRFDPDVTRLHEIAKDMAAAFGYTATLGIDGELAQLLRLRVAQLNPCSYCLILHTEAAHAAGSTRAKVAHLLSWRESTLFSPEENAALEYAEMLTVFDQTGFAAAHARMVELFDQRSIAEVASVVINMNVWTRLKLAQGATPLSEGGRGAEDTGRHP